MGVPKKLYITFFKGDAEQKQHKEYEEVFTKCMAYFLSGRLDNLKYISKKYVHIFIIRDPNVSVASLHRVSTNKDLTEGMLRLYYEKVGLGYQPSMIKWDNETEEKMAIFNAWPQGWFQTLLSATSFAPVNHQPRGNQELPEEVQRVIQECILPYYNELKKSCLKV